MSLVLRKNLDNGVVLLRMNRPKAMNALSLATRLELDAHFKNLNDDSLQLGADMQPKVAQ